MSQAISLANATRKHATVCLTVLMLILDVCYKRIGFGQNGLNLTQESTELSQTPSNSIGQAKVKSLSLDESVRFDVTDDAKVLAIKLGIVRPKTTLSRCLSITGLRSSESEELELVRSCSCLSVEINKDTNASVIVLDAKLKPDSPEGLSERSIWVRRVKDGAELLTIKFEYTVRDIFEVSPRAVDVTDAEKKQVDFAAKLYDENSEAKIEVVGAKITGPWVMGSSFKNSNSGLVITGVVSFSGQEKSTIESQSHNVIIDYLIDGKKSSSDIEVSFRRQLPMRLIKNRVLMVEDKGSKVLSAKLWLKGAKGVSPSEQKLVGRIEFDHTNNVPAHGKDIAFSLVSDSLWIGKFSMLREEFDVVARESKDLSVSALLVVDENKLPFFFTVEGADHALEK